MKDNTLKPDIGASRTPKVDPFVNVSGERKLLLQCDCGEPAFVTIGGWNDEADTYYIGITARPERLWQRLKEAFDVMDGEFAVVGYNTCLAEVKQALDIESES